MLFTIGFSALVALMFGGGYYYFTHISKRLAVFTVIILLNFIFLYFPMKIIQEQTKNNLFTHNSELDLSFIMSSSFYLPIIICIVMNITHSIIVNKVFKKYGWDNEEEQQKENNDND